jgi:hypothetical protein
MISCNLADPDRPWLSVFRDSLPYGYFNYSQPNTYFEVIKFIDTSNVYVGSNTYAYNFSTNKWALTSSTITPSTDLATNKFIRDQYTQQLYYIQDANTILPVAKNYTLLHEDKNNQTLYVDNEFTVKASVSSFTVTPSAVGTTGRTSTPTGYLLCYVNGDSKYIPLYD